MAIQGVITIPKLIGIVKNPRAGVDGATFIPSVDSAGNLSWTNNGGLDNPKTVNIKGEKGDKGEQGIQGEQGYTPVRKIDYWTETDIEEIKTYCNDYIDTQITQVIGGAY